MGLASVRLQAQQGQQIAQAFQQFGSLFGQIGQTFDNYDGAKAVYSQLKDKIPGVQPPRVGTTAKEYITEIVEPYKELADEETKRQLEAQAIKRRGAITTAAGEVTRGVGGLGAPQQVTPIGETEGFTEQEIIPAERPETRGAAQQALQQRTMGLPGGPTTEEEFKATGLADLPTEAQLARETRLEEQGSERLKIQAAQQKFREEEAKIRQQQRDRQMQNQEARTRISAYNASLSRDRNAISRAKTGRLRIKELEKVQSNLEIEAGMAKDEAQFAQTATQKAIARKLITDKQQQLEDAKRELQEAKENQVLLDQEARLAPKGSAAPKPKEEFGGSTVGRFKVRVKRP